MVNIFIFFIYLTPEKCESHLQSYLLNMVKGEVPATGLLPLTILVQAPPQTALAIDDIGGFGAGFANFPSNLKRTTADWSPFQLNNRFSSATQ